MALIRRWLRRTNRALDLDPPCPDDDADSPPAATPAPAAADRGRPAPDPDRPSWWERNRQYIEVGGVWLESMGVVVAALVAINQYQANSRAERVRQTLSYLDRFQEDRLYDARRTLEDAWNAKSDQVFALMAAPGGEARLTAFIAETIAAEKLDPQITTVVDFYDELQACTEASLCDHDTAVRFFGKYANDLDGLLTPYFQQQRNDLHDPLIASGIDYFSVEYRRMTTPKGP